MREGECEGTKTRGSPLALSFAHLSRSLEQANFAPIPFLLSRCGKVMLRWPNTVFCARFTDSVSDAIKRALGLWYANTAVDKVIPQFHMNWIIKLNLVLNS